jgi:aryl-alcohol dehydrogenase-like predicted oxidoreductase
VIPTQLFGSTGHESTRLIFGAAALWRASQTEAARCLEQLLEAGVNHIDVAASYGDAELRVGEWMLEHRRHFFLATKTGERGYAGARRSIHRSLERLRVEGVDLIQLHNLVDEEGWEEALSESGALRACVEAREQGLVRFIGVTGHGTGVARRHLQSLERFSFDSVLLPYNLPMMQSREYAHSFEALLARCREGGAAVQTIKSLARRRWAEGVEPTRSTWYEPFEAQADIDRSLHWALSRSGIFVNSAGDLGLLPRILDAAQRFDPDAEVADATLAARLEVAEARPLWVSGYRAGG